MAAAPAAWATVTRNKKKSRSQDVRTSDAAARSRVRFARPRHSHHRRGRSNNERTWRRGQKQEPRRLTFRNKQQIRESVCNMQSEREFCRWLNGYMRRIGVDQIDGVTYALHRCAEHDDLKLAESLLKPILNEKLLARISNNKESKQEYTPLCRAAYRGSLRMIKLLCAAHADVNFVNSHGETLNDALRVGRQDAVKADPDNAIFINARFNECEQFVVARQRFLQAKAASACVKKKKWRPKSYYARVIYAWMLKYGRSSVHKSNE